MLVSWVALERAILSPGRVIYLVRPGCHVTLRCSRTRSSGMLRRFPVFADATQWLALSLGRVREGEGAACYVVGRCSRTRCTGLRCRRVANRGLGRGVECQGYPGVCRSCARYWPTTRKRKRVPGVIGLCAFRAIAPGLTFLFVLPALLAFGFRSPYFWQGKRFRISTRAKRWA